MNSDAILLGLSGKEFRKEVDEAFRACRALQRGDRRPAAASKWAATSLAADMIVLEQVTGVDTQAIALSWLMRWALEAKFGNTSPTDTPELRQRCYNSLYFPYFKDESLEIVANRIGFSDPSPLYDSRTLAISEIAKLLQEELQAPRYQDQRRTFAITQLIHELSDPQAAILRLLAVFEQPIPLVKLKQMVKDVGITTHPERPITHLTNAGFARTNVTDESIQIVELLRAQLLLLTEVAESRRYYSIAAQSACETGEYLVAATYWSKAGKPDQAVTVLVAYYEQIINAGQIVELYALQSSLRKGELTPDLWAQLKLMLGRAALLVDDKEVAIRELKDAFSTENLTDRYIKIRACYYLGKIYEKENFWNALAQFERGIELIEGAADNQEQRTTDLLADLYIGKAWLYIQMQPDVEQAATCLRNAQKLIQGEDASRLTAFHAAQAALEFAKKQQLESEIRDRYKALVAAEESGNQAAICNACFNLAQAYRYANYLQEARHYLTRAYDLAQELKDSEKQGQCFQEQGAIAFGEAAYAEASELYQQANEIYKRKKLETRIGWVGYDLAEVYAKQGKWEQARQAHKQALTIATKGNQFLQNELDALTANYPQFLEKLNERQSLAMDHVNQHDEISKGRYEEITGTSNSTALRELKEMVDMGLLQQIGKGPSTRYVRADNSSTA
jgi:tetratricopeptide (TPR) repeat protein